MSNSHLSVPKYDQEPQNFSRSQAWSHSEDNDNKSHYTIRKAESRTSLCSYRSSRDLLDFIADIRGRMYSSMSDLYVLPSDQEEWERLNKFHNSLLLALGNLCPDMDIVDTILAPPSGASKSVLDLGCGTGRWCMEMGYRYPNADVVGVDLVPYPLNPDTTAQQCHFELDNVDLGLSHFFDQFDLVHARCIELGLSDYKKMVEEATFCLRPGGLLILAEIDWQLYEEDMKTPVIPASDEHPKGCWIQRFLEESRDAACKNGSDLLETRQVLQEGLWDKPNIDNTTSASLYLPISNPSEVQELPRRMESAASLMKQNLMASLCLLDSRSLVKLKPFSRRFFIAVYIEFFGRQKYPKNSSTSGRRKPIKLERGDKRLWIRVRYAWGRREASPEASPTEPSSTDTESSASSHPVARGEGSFLSAEIHQMLKAETELYPYFYIYQTQEEARAAFHSQGD
ncbi:hypothetical protein FRC16_000032 [Serendipita sp. 398]|nr:hypothetical protein FRC16_000032 [Serendipita sp. 398]